MSSCTLTQLRKSFTKLSVGNIFNQTRSFYPPTKYRPPKWFVPKERVISEDGLTSENKAFIQEVIQDKLCSQPVLHSPLTGVTNEPEATWNLRTRRTGLIARKIGNYPMWLKNGTKVQTTLLQVVDNQVIKYIPPDEFKPMVIKNRNWREKRTLGCLIVGSETVDPSTVTKEYCGLFSSVGMMPKRHLSRFLITPNAVLPTGTPLFATHFRVGDYIDVKAKTIDRGFQGVMVRWGFKGMPKTHGVTKTHRRPGNIGSGGEKARVMPGTKMPGHMGNNWRILRGVKILRINTKHNVLWTLGVGIPGETGAMCRLYDTVLPDKKLAEAPPFPTHPPAEDLPLEYYDESVHCFEDPTITYEET